ncbi:MAG: serine/threonine protein kinase [Akkermansiaceae bacterium]
MDITYYTETDEYKIIKQIGEGGTAIVCSAHSKARAKVVALKLFRNHERDDEVFLHEAEILSKIKHPNIVNPIDSGYDKGSEFIVMSLIEGQDLEIYLRKNDFDEMAFIDFALQALEALTVIHDRHILHLDIKPSNIMITTSKDTPPLVSLIDFGASKRKSNRPSERIIGKRGLKGSIYFMSPEQINQQRIDERSDIYSMGCVFYQMLTKTQPFQGDTALQVIAAHIQNMHTPIMELLGDRLSPNIGELIERMISADANDRPSYATEALATLYIHKMAMKTSGRSFIKTKPL